MSDRIDDWAMLAVQGPLAREMVQAGADGPLPERMTTGAAPHLRRRGARLRHRLHRRGRRRAAVLARARPRSCGASCVRRGARPAGLGARDTLRLEVCFHLYGNELTRRARADRGRARLVLQGGHGLHRRRGGARRARVRARRRSSSRSRSTGAGIARQGNPSTAAARSRAARSRRAWSVGIGMAYVPAERAAVGHAPRDRRARAHARGARRREAARPEAASR